MMKNEPWKLFVDDIRHPPDAEKNEWIIARSSAEAIQIVKDRNCLPKVLALDHDLGGDDTIMIFLRDLVEHWETVYEGKAPIPKYRAHSANPIGVNNIISFMTSWKKSTEL